MTAKEKAAEFIEVFSNDNTRDSERKAYEHANLEGFENGTEDFTTEFKKHIKDTIEDELADAFIRLLDTAEGWGVDLQRHVELKMLYNAKRERLHGKKY